jgi:acyl transferase domain-containing protein
MVPGEAVVAVVLKTVSRAERDGDPIHAVIRASGINYDGKTNGITAPSGVSQAALLRAVYQHYRIQADDIDYIVTHGTGTKLGDPIEINALYDAFRHYTQKQAYCALTSTKTNLGHTLAASGLVSLISLVQALRHHTIPASLHCQQENDYINWKESPFYVNKASRAWQPVAGQTRIGAVSAFGISGTHAHMVVQSYDQDQQANAAGSTRQAPSHLLVLSAKTEAGLHDKINDLVAVLQGKQWDRHSLSAMSYTLLEGRHHFQYRCAVVVEDRDHAIGLLQQAAGKEKLPNLLHGKVARDFAAQKMMQQYAQELVAQGTSLWEQKSPYQDLLLALADAYCQGYVLDWSGLYGDIKPRRISLPTYPFAKERY